MTDNNVADLKNYVKSNVSKKQFAELEQGLESADSAKAEKIKTAKLKEPSVTTVLSSVFGLFGGGSFYLGQIKRGIIKVIFNVVVPVLVICLFLVQKVNEIVYLFFLIIIIIDAVIIFAYWIGEVFRDREKCHNMNYESIKKVLEE